MKKVLFIMAAALMTMTQCRKQETMPVTPSANTIKMTVTAGSGAKTDINTETGAITWSEGDKLYVSDGTSWLGSLTLVSGADTPQGTFTGSVTGLDDEGVPCHFFYLGRDNGMTEPTAGTGTDAVISLASQDGTLRGENGAMKYHAGYGRTDVTVKSGEYQGYVVMNTKIAIAHINFTKDSQPYTGSVTMGGTGVSNTLSVNPDGTFSGDGTDGITIGGTTGERYVTLIPTETTGVLNVAFTGDATGSMTFAKGIHENKFYGMSEAIAVTLEAAGPTHEYVDLGLPSGLLWATCNVGADSPEKYGDYYQWGGVESVTSTDINVGWDGCPFTNGKYSSSNKKVFTKYVPTGMTEYWAGSGDPDNKLVLDPEDDAAHVNWGGDWRMPTSAEFGELYDNTVCTWTTENGVNGHKFTSTKEGYTDKYIFLPAAALRAGTDVEDLGVFGYYWSSSLCSSNDPRSAYSMWFDSEGVNPRENYDYRCQGLPVRPVQ